MPIPSRGAHPRLLGGHGHDCSADPPKGPRRWCCLSPNMLRRAARPVVPRPPGLHTLGDDLSRPSGPTVPWGWAWLACPHGTSSAGNSLHPALPAHPLQGPLNIPSTPAKSPPSAGRPVGSGGSGGSGETALFPGP